MKPGFYSTKERPSLLFPNSRPEINTSIGTKDNAFSFERSLDGKKVGSRCGWNAINKFGTNNCCAPDPRKSGQVTSRKLGETSAGPNLSTRDHQVKENG